MKNCGNCANYDHAKMKFTDICGTCVIGYVGNAQQEPSNWKPLPQTNAPTVDAVPVVRCKDCIYWESGKSYIPYCNRFEGGLQDCEADDFCSYGERRSEQAWITRRK